MATSKSDAEHRDQEDVPQKAHGRTLADEEIERIEQKSTSGKVLDPIALDDPMGLSVEKVVLRVGITIVIVVVFGILLAQVACKNIRLSSMVNLADGVSEESVSRMLSNGTIWSGDTLRFQGVTFGSYDEQAGVLEVIDDETSSRVFEQSFATGMTRSSAFAMNAFGNPEVRTVIYTIKTHLSSVDGKTAFSADNNDPVGTACQIIWTRDDPNGSSYSCKVEGPALPALTQGVM